MRPIAFTTSGYAIAGRKGRAICAVGVMACGLSVLQACSGSDAVAPISPSNAVPVSQVLGSITVGKTFDTPVRISVTDANGQALAGAAVTWVAGNGGSVSVSQPITNASGIASAKWTVGTVAGLQTLTAYVDGVAPVIFGANAVADKATVVKFNTDLVRITVLGDTVHVWATGTDQYGNSVSTPANIVVESGAEALTAVNGGYVARDRGTAVLKATVDTASTRLSVYVDPLKPILARVLPDTIVAGGTIVIEGQGFTRLPEYLDVTIAGVKASVTSVSPSRIEAVVPSTYGCVPTMSQTVKVTVAATTGQKNTTLRTSNRISLAKGESVNILDANKVQCTELAAPAGGGNAKYVVAVINTSVTAAATSGFELRGAGAGAMAGKTSTPVANTAVARMANASTNLSMTSAGRGSRLSAVMTQLEADKKVEAQHDNYLDAQRAINSRYGSPAAAWRARTNNRIKSAMASTRSAAQLGDTITMKALYSSCAVGRDIRARVVYVGTKALVLEDIASPRAGTMDNQYQLIGAEYDQVQYPLMRDNVGDPLAMNDIMGGDGRVTMLFTRYVNDSLPGITGYVSACNLYPKSTFAASNEDEVFYARVADLAEAPSDWRRVMRTNVMHETKHLASFAIRMVNSTPFEESWLEESLARVAEELYARTFAHSASWRSNSGFQETVQCELFQCDDRPLMMWKHFSVLHQYYRGVDTLSPIGAAANGDFTYYASGWSFVRWAADQYAGDESAWIKDLVRGGQLTGLSNLAQKTGRPVGEMLADWSLANAVDDLPGFVPVRRQLTFPSWNTSNIFAGLASTFPGNFMTNPLGTRAMTFGSFTLPVNKLRAFSSSYFSFEGTQTGSQLLELRGENGNTMAPGNLRVAVVRVQ